MIEAGIKKEHLTLLAPLAVPWGLVASLSAGQLIGRFSALQTFKAGMIGRLGMVLVWLGQSYTFLSVCQPFLSHTFFAQACLSLSETCMLHGLNLTIWLLGSTSSGGYFFMSYAFSS